jgi:acyl-CoA synthetase (AMP-forming)/AMP-acid ligase II
VGYHSRPEETAEAITEDRWLRTGDLGKVDEDGYLFITGRAKELIIFGGENIMPLEIENALCLHPAVAEAAVIGVPDETKGEVPVAAVVLLEGQSVEASALREFLKDKIAPFKVPRDFHFVEELPKNTLNKVLKPQLREMLVKS